LIAVAVITLSRRKLQESGGGRGLKLLSVIVMLALRLLLLLKPDWLGTYGRG
jgi:hypothetical protein